MAFKNPIRQILQNVVEEFQTINTNCLHMNVEINALIEERTKIENHKVLRRFCRCLKLVDELQPETRMPWKEKISEIMRMLRIVSSHYDDLKRRYFWALDRLTESTIKLNRVAEDQIIREAKSKDLGESWEDFCKEQSEQIVVQSEVKQDYSKKELPISCKESDVEDIDKLLGMTFIGKNKNSVKKRHKEIAEMKSSDSRSVCTKVKISPKLTTIEDHPLIGMKGDGKKRTKVSKILKNVQRSLKNVKNGVGENEKEATYFSEIKLQMYSLMAEIAEREEFIDSLIAQMKIKDVQIAQLSSVIRREKLGIESATYQKSQTKSETFDKDTLIFSKRMFIA